MITTGSRYSDSPTVVVVRPGTQTRTVITAGPQNPFTITYWWCILAEGDTLSSLAFSNYGDPTKWWKIADANPEVMDWTTIAPGSLLRIPVNS
jgi:LysM domain-containing protein